VRIDELSFQRGKEIVAAKPEILASILAVIVNAQEAHLRNSRISVAEHLRREFLVEGWPQYNSRNLFLNEQIAIEISNGRGGIKKFLSDKKINVVVVVTEAKKLQLVKAEFEGIRITVPIWFIGLK
jgi:hypothetical protein